MTFVDFPVTPSDPWRTGFEGNTVTLFYRLNSRPYIIVSREALEAMLAIKDDGKTHMTGPATNAWRFVYTNAAGMLAVMKALEEVASETTA